jgi:hypothetical protein
VSIAPIQVEFFRDEFVTEVTREILSGGGDFIDINRLNIVLDTLDHDRAELFALEAEQKKLLDMVSVVFDGLDWLKGGAFHQDPKYLSGCLREDLRRLSVLEGLS